jgi:hypothetical protein
MRTQEEGLQRTEDMKAVQGIQSNLASPGLIVSTLSWEAALC